MLILAATLLVGSKIYVSDLDLSQVRQGWGKAMRNRSVTDTPLSIDGKVFDKGIGSHAISTFRIRLDGKATRFHAFCGVDDNAKSSGASIVFHVLADGKERWHSGIRTWKQPALEVDVPLQGVRVLTLSADDAGDGVSYDHVDWADPTIDYSGKTPVALVPPVEKAVILTPPPPKSPRINGPSVVGVRPGHPFLYLMPVTGTRPMAYVAKGLPSGLTLHADRIVGKIARPGEYRVTLIAKNRFGDARRTLRIKCGDKIALTPYMGWNSWYVWLNTVSDQKMRDAADAMIRSGLAQHGWQYVNIDDCWARVPGQGAPTRDEQGKILSGDRFPNMVALTDYIHSKGLKAGIYTSPGPTTCAGYEGAFHHEAADAKRFADWGFDFLKYDWCSYKAEAPGLEGFEKPYRLMGRLVAEQNRDMVFNLCQYGMGKVWQWGEQVQGHSWRTAGDLGIGFTMYEDGFDLYAKEHMERYARPGAYNDPDYLLLGQIAAENGKTKPSPFTPNEQYTQVSFWSLVAAPLIFSGDVAHIDPFTLSLLTNDEVIAVDQDPLVKAAKRVSKDGDQEAWARPLEDGSWAVGLFNRGEDPAPVKVAWSSFGQRGRLAVRDLWRQKELGRFGGGYSATVPRHGVVLIKVRR